MLPCAKSLQFICPQLLKGLWVSFCPSELVWHWCVGKALFKNTSRALSPDGKAQENALCFRPGSFVLCNAPLSKKHGKSCSWESISFVSAFTRVWTGQARCKCLHWSMICLILCPKFKHFWFYLPVNFSTFFTMAPMPSKIWCSAVSHMNAGVVTTLFFVSTWAS